MGQHYAIWQQYKNQLLLVSVELAQSKEAAIEQYCNLVYPKTIDAQTGLKNLLMCNKISSKAKSLINQNKLEKNFHKVMIYNRQQAQTLTT